MHFCNTHGLGCAVHMCIQLHTGKVEILQGSMYNIHGTQNENIIL